MVDVSVIVPVYNAEKYLDDCLKSLVNQTLNNLEIIAVDDNSTDNSLAILGSYQRTYPNLVKVVHLEENQGQSVARNIGIKLARGEYVGFLDSDDYVNFDMYKSMYEEALSNDKPEVIVTGLLFVRNSSYLESNFKSLAQGTRRKGRVYDVLEDPGIVTNQSPSVCNKLFRRDTLENKLFLEGRMWEDVAFSFGKMFTANKILVLNNYDYFYRRRAGEGVSGSGYQVNSKLMDIFDVADDIGQKVSESGRAEALKNEVQLIQTATCLQRAVEVLSWSISKEDQDLIITGICQQVIARYGDWRIIPVEDLSSKIGILELDKMNALIDNSTPVDLTEVLDAVIKNNRPTHKF